MAGELLTAVALVLIIEGLMPALSPRGWRNLIEQLGQMPDNTIRVGGMALILIGAVLFHLVR